MLLSKYRHKLKYLLTRKQNHAGRNNTGKITVAHQGGGHKQLYRKTITNGSNLYYKYLKGFVTNFEYDPNRSSYLAKICYTQNNFKKYYYIIAPQSLKILDDINHTLNKYPTEISKRISNQKQVGNSYYLHEIKVGDFIYNIELYPNKGGQLVRSGGTFATILQKNNERVLIKLPSGEHRLVDKQCKAFFGNLSNENYRKVIWKKAGKARWLNKRPTVRGVAMNPIDHPHGGNTSGGRHHMTPWSRLTKGIPTRSLKKENKFIVKPYKIRTL